MSKPIHWQCDDNLHYNSFWCELDPEKTPQRSGYGCRFCHDQEVRESYLMKIVGPFLMPQVLQIQKTMQDHCTEPVSIESALRRLIGIGIEEWDRERRDD
jgi:hypothetical protein